MNVWIRVEDSSEEIGSGHVVRCLTLAEKLVEQGANVCFLSRDLPGNVLGFVRRSSFALHLLALPTQRVNSEPGSSWFGGISWQSDGR